VRLTTMLVSAAGVVGAADTIQLRHRQRQPQVLGDGLGHGCRLHRPAEHARNAPGLYSLVGRLPCSLMVTPDIK
jgi:hypothetical protein